MSQYVNFYLKKGDTWATLVDYSRNSQHYKMIETVIPYGELVPLNADIMNEVSGNISEEIEGLKKSRERALKEIETIAAMPNPVDEKLEAIAESQGTVNWAEEELDQMRDAKSFYSFISDIMDNGGWLYKTSEYVWAGIEACPPDGEE